jgi:hypothetical protein
MMNLSKTFIIRASKTAKELEAALNRALQAHPECQDIKVLKIALLENGQGLANWDAEFLAQSGSTISADRKRMLIGVKKAVQKHFDLALRVSTKGRKDEAIRPKRRETLVG